MRKIYTLLVFALLTCSIHAQNTVTFKVDMSQQTVDATGVHIAGSFQSPAWDPAGTAMTDPDGDGVYEYVFTTMDPVGTVYEFKYINGNAWGGDEAVPGACAQNNNRFVAVVAGNVDYAACFGSCDPTCATSVPVNVTFQVNMTNMIAQFGVPDSGVHIAGSLQGWNPSATPMTDADGDGTYEVTLNLGNNTFYEYKYVFGNAWGFDESVSDTLCNSGNNRGITVGMGDSTIAPVCFGLCTDCAPLDGPYVATMGVDMSNEIHNPDSVYMVGTITFPANEQTIRLTDPDGDQIYTRAISLYSGEYQFRFRSVGASNPDENGGGNPYDFAQGGCGVSTQFGARRALTIQGANVVKGYVWNTCTAVTITSTSHLAAQALAFNAQPNPFNNSTLITFENKNNESYALILTNSVGQVVRQINNITADRVELLRGNLNSGLYFATLMNENGQRYTQKLIVE